MNAALRLELERTRSARVVLDPRGHGLLVDLGHASAMFSRAEAEALNRALLEVDAETALVLLGAFARGIRSLDDVHALQRATLAFEDEMALEDRRSDDRMFKASKAVPL